jgi:hypothetical protein
MAVWADMERDIENILLIAHRRWGKDEIGLNDCAIQAAKVPANYFYCLPEQEHARRALWSSINPKTGKRRMDECFPPGFRIGNLKEQEMAVDVHSRGGQQSRIQFLGSDNYNAIVGGSPRGVYFSEWAIADPQALAMIRPIVEENKGFLRFLTTPRGKMNHVYRQMKAQAGKPGWAVHYQTALDTQIFSQEQLDKLRQEAIDLYGPEVGESLFRQEYLCTFEEVSPGSFYGDLINMLEKTGQIGNLVPIIEEPVYACFDIGYSDSMAIWYAQIMNDGTINLIAYDEFRKKDIPATIKILKEYPWNYGALLLPHDAVQHEVTSGETVETLLTKNGFLCYTKPQTDESPQIESVRQILPRCNFNEKRCERGITCLRSYHNKFKEKLGVWSPNAVHDWSSHGAKAFATLAYFANALRRGAQNAKSVATASAAGDFFSRDRKYAGVSGGGTSWMK